MLHAGHSSSIEARDPLLSVVIPAYNEASRLPRTLEHIARFAVTQSYTVEVIVVDNNSTDGTAEVARAHAPLFDQLHVLAQPIQGKGAAVRAGLLAASGRHIFIADADLSMPIAELDKFLTPEACAVNVAIGSREASGAHRYDEPWHRHLMGRVFNRLVNGLFGLRYSDTQCGFKCFRRDVARDLALAQTIDGFAFDVELLLISRLRGYRVIEVPIEWAFDDQSRVSPLKHTVMMVGELLRIKGNEWRQVYAVPDTGAVSPKSAGIG
jgi:glycosyltransferase involved in cell wall biosynthesis